MTKITITILFLIIGQFTIAQDNRIRKVDSLLNVLYANKKINGNILIAEKGNVIYQKSFGLANETTKEALTENSIFELASVSKQFTAMAIMILKEQGKLKLEDDITKYLPELSNYKGLTIKNLLHHTSGLADYEKLMDSLFDKSKIATNKDIINLFAKHKPKLIFAPDTKFEYSNTGYAFLASIIEKASGKTFANYLEKAIFKPLQMKNTFVYTRRIMPKKVDNYAFGYVYSDSLKKYALPDDVNETKYVIWLDGIVGDGTVNSTTGDLLKWDRALYTNKLLSENGMKQLYETSVLTDNTKTNYGMGWFIEKHADFGKMANHSGGWPGYVLYIDRHLDNDKTIIILQNHEKATIPVNSIRNILYNKPLVSQTAKKEIKLPNDQLQKFVGIYEIKDGPEMIISLENEQLFTKLGNQDAYPIFAEKESLFFLKVVDAQLQFVTNNSGVTESVFLLQNGRKIEARRKN